MKIAIQGHPTKYKKVIDILINLGGVNKRHYTGDDSDLCYYIDELNHIQSKLISEIDTDVYKLHTLEGFEKEFPFKIGDIVQTVPNGQAGIITALCPDPVFVIAYKIRYNSKRELLFPSQILKLYTPMKEERHVVLSLDKAREWYNKGGELKEVALQVFTEKELKNPLPQSWEEYCKGYKVPAMIFGPCIPNKYVALWKLEQLRDCYRQGWKPDWKNCYTEKYCIVLNSDKLMVSLYGIASRFLAFQSKEVAEDFLKNFDYLIKEAGDLI